MECLVRDALSAKQFIEGLSSAAHRFYQDVCLKKSSGSVDNSLTKRLSEVAQWYRDEAGKLGASFAESESMGDETHAGRFTHSRQLS
jgi:hypothetical protein